MRVLNVINSLEIGGAEKLVVDSLVKYSDNGIKADLLLLNGKKTLFYENLEKQNKNKIFSLGLGSVYNPVNIFRIIPYLKKYDIVHVHLFPALYFVAIAKVFSFSKAKLFYTEHSTSNKRIRMKFFFPIDRIIYNVYEKIICITPEVKKVLQNYLHLKELKTVVILNGVNLKKIDEAISYDRKKINHNLNNDDFVLIQVSSFNEPKDQVTIIKALNFLPKKTKLLLVGDGSLRSKNEEITKKMNLFDRVFFLGLRDDVPELLKSSDAVILSSNYEGMSLASIEGMYSGKPFLASNVPGLKEIVGGAGILFKKGDSKELALKISKLIDEKEYCNEVVEHCMVRAKQYSIDYTVDQYIKCYKKAIRIDG